MHSLLDRSHWVFDMDGTLTVAVHDFDAIHRALGVPAEEPILEWVAAQPHDRTAALYIELDKLELEFARLAVAQDGAVELLEALHARGATTGIVTRNSEPIARETLRLCGLDRYFDPPDVIGRESAPAKPSPAGIEHLLGRWQAEADRAVMIGDYVFDLEAGRRAGCVSVYYDPDRKREWDGHADCSVRSHRELLALAQGVATTGEA